MKGPDKDKWEKAVFEEHQRMAKNQFWRAVPKKDVPKNAKVMSSTWAMKKKSNGTYIARLNARGYEQVYGIHYDSSNISSPVTNDATIRIIMVLMIIFKWSAQLVDVKGAFSCGNFKDGEEIFMEVPEGFEEFYGAYMTGINKRVPFSNIEYIELAIYYYANHSFISIKPLVVQFG
jgi:hypothetical protein